MIWVIIYTFEAFFRYVLNLMHLSPLIYFKTVVLFMVIIIGIIKVFQTLIISRNLLLIICMILIGMVFGIINDLQLAQIFFGLNIISPLLAGFIYIYFGEFKSKTFVTLYRILTPFIVGGLVLDLFLDLPWNGLVYSIGEYEVVGNRDWTSYSVERLSGFQRASFESATLIYLLIVLYLAHNEVNNYKNKLLLKVYDTVLFFISVYGIYLTTSKTVYLAIILLPVFLLPLKIYKIVNNRIGEKLISVFIKLSLIFLLGFGLVPPLLSFTNLDFTSKLILSDSFLSQYLFSSYFTRLDYVWPEALNIMNNSNFTLFGRGLGGLGASQKQFEQEIANPVDNFYLFLIVNFGVMGIYVIYKLIKGIICLNLKEQYNIYLYVLLIVLFSFGGTLTVLESGMLTLVIGILLSLYLKEKQKSKMTCKREVGDI